jgi:phenylpropionate dioxygenase-like ring-hydroxylating dioxygenase large terminal subunit
MGSFNDPEQITEGWYLVARADEVRPGKVVSRSLLERPLALYRGGSGRVHALHARCPHLGADLAGGEVLGDDLRCPFHHWTFDGEGGCLRAPGLAAPPAFARTFSYPVHERHGSVWVYAGAAPRIPFPHFEAWLDEDLAVMRLAPQVLGCHPHIAAMNGLDVQHFRTVHRFSFAEEPRLEQPDPFRVQLRLELLLTGHNAFEKALRAVAGPRVGGTFTTWGGNMATIEGRAGPVEVLVLFTHRPLPGGRSASQTFLFLPRRRRRGLASVLAKPLEQAAWAVARTIMGYILHGDRDIVDNLRYRARLTEADEPLKAFVRVVNALQAFDPERATCAGEPSAS